MGWPFPPLMQLGVPAVCQAAAPRLGSGVILRRDRPLDSICDVMLHKCQGPLLCAARAMLQEQNVGQGPHIQEMSGQ